jgi:ketosteroid isomerase-like protein
VKRSAVSLALLAGLALAGPAAAKPKRPPLRFASPAAIVAADVVLSQLAQRKGQWKAMRDTAADGAVLFVPQPVVARDWLKARKDTPPPVIRQSHQVWLSCDGSLAVSTGAWQQAGGGQERGGQQRGGQGDYVTVWQRQPKGDYKWVLDQHEPLAIAPPAPEMIGAGVATCDRDARPPQPGAPPPPAPVFPAGTRGGWSDDRTLSWSVAVDAACGRALTVSLGRGAGKPLEPVLQKSVAPAEACPA